MSLPYPKYLGDARRELTGEFRGYNATDTCLDQNGKMSFSDMVNGGTDRYPFAASRLPRKKIDVGEESCAIFGADELVRVQPPYLFYGDEQIDIGLLDGEKQFVMMGTELLIFPDGMYYNTVNGEFGPLDEREPINGTVYFRRIKINGEYHYDDDRLYCDVEYFNTLSNSTISNSEFIFQDFKEVNELNELPTVIKWYFGVNGTTNYFYKCKEDLYYPYRGTLVDDGSVFSYELKVSEWKKLVVSEVDFYVEGTPEAVARKDKNIWCGNEVINLKSTGKADNPCYKITLSNGIFRYFEKIYRGGKDNDNNDYYELAGDISWTARKFPLFDHVCVHDNRLWGCRYGDQVFGETLVNRIYVSALGENKNFLKFQGISTDSWYGDCGEKGPFTGACVFNGRPIFFKEDFAYIIYGDYPPYSYNKIDIKGVAIGAAKSLCSVNNVLYWKSRHGIMRYTGSSLNTISEMLGDISNVSKAVGGSYKDKYYISLDNLIYVYDTERNLWAKEDKIVVKDFAEVDGKSYFLSSDGELYQIGGQEKEDFSWSITTPNIGYSYPNRKYVSQIRIRIDMSEDVELPKVEVSLDENDFVECKTKVDFKDVGGKRSGTILIPMSSKRCEIFKIRLSGRGEYKITGITKVIEESGI